ncbi:MAG TPA: outer membrane lipoprotein carrier protein LolA [Thermohalobaculum sp.]|nr:outer membrane lipoprotein carrier protein LolA [Thermohalobaculum sp.]
MNRRTLLLGAAGAIVATLPGPGFAQSGEDARDLTRITNYLNGITTMQGAFVQVGPDGDASEGEFYMRRPGRVRFEYRPPNPTLIVADGTWVAVQDTRMNTLDRYPLGQTPLDILLSDRVDLRSAGAVQSIERSGTQMRVTAVDPDNPGQGSITMVFNDNPLELTQWVVRDAQGLTTTVALSNTRSNVQIDPGKFFIEGGEGAGAGTNR